MHSYNELFVMMIYKNMKMNKNHVFQFDFLNISDVLQNSNIKPNNFECVFSLESNPFSMQ